MTKASTLVAGGFGGIAPSLVAIANQARLGNPGPEGYLFAQPGFLVGALVSALLGVALVFFYSESSARKAVALGAAAPSLILGFGQGLPAGQNPDHSSSGQTSMAEWVVGAAQAAEPPRESVVPAQAAGDSVWIRIAGLATAGTRPTQLVVTYASAIPSPAPGSAAEEITIHLGRQDTVVAVPRLLRDRPVREVYIAVAGVSSERVAVARTVGDTLHLTADVENRSFMSSFARAFGVRSVAPVKVTLKARSSR